MYVFWLNIPFLNSLLKALFRCNVFYSEVESTASFRNESANKTSQQICKFTNKSTDKGLWTCKKQTFKQKQSRNSWEKSTLSTLDLLKWTSLVTLSASSSCFYSASVGSVNSLKMGKLFPGVTASQEEKVDHEIGWKHHQLSSLSQWLLIDGLVNITYSGSSSL